MLKFLILSNSETINKAVKMALEMTLVQNEITPTVYPILLRTDADGSEEKRLAEFSRVATQIEDYLIKQSDYVHDRFIGIIDCPNMTDVYDLHALTSIAGALIIAFPTIQWIPLYKDANLLTTEEEETKGRMTLRKAIDLCCGGYSPLFDGDGLRGILLSRVRDGGVKKTISPRVDLAFAVDEESHYAFMNAYTAFRFGYRSIPVMSGRCADMFLRDLDEFPHAYPVFDEKSVKNNGKQQLDKSEAKKQDTQKEEQKKQSDTKIRTTVAFEDLFLKFPDRTDADLKEIDFGKRRDDNLSVLRQATVRVITTSSANEEKVANDQMMTLDKFFAQDHTRKRIANWKTKTRKSSLKNHWERKIFNYLGGYWRWWWLLNLVNWCVFLIILLGALCCHKNIPLLILACVFPYMLWRNANRDRISKEIGHGGGRNLSVRVKRWQWSFLPKLYENHNPLWLDDIPNQEGKTFWEVAHKPTAGIFGLRNKCGLPNGCKFMGIYNSEKIRRLYEHAIHKSVFTLPEEEKTVNGHGAPGMAQEIAMWLVRRAERMKNYIIDTEGAVQAAVLSDIACELLDCKTPTMAIEALKWKHYFEVLAECEFVGVTDEIDVKDRYIDIHNGLGRICRSENGIVREKVFNSGMAEIMDTLATLLRNKGKMEEAAFFTNYSRKYHRKLMRPFLRSLLAYPEWVLFRPLNFGISFSLLFLFFAVYCFSHVTGHQIWSSITATCTVLFTQVSDFSEYQDIADFPVVASIARQMAYLHLGFIAAHFLLFVNRR